MKEDQTIFANANDNNSFFSFFFLISISLLCMKNQFVYWIPNCVLLSLFYHKIYKTIEDVCCFIFISCYRLSVRPIAMKNFQYPDETIACGKTMRIKSIRTWMQCNSVYKRFYGKAFSKHQRGKCEWKK